MKTDNPVQSKSYAFAIRIVNVYKYIIQNHQEFVLSKQLLRCGTSIGANVEEALGGQSQKDFLHKLSISYKEAREAAYWIKLLRDTHYLDNQQSQSLLNDVDELLRIIGSIQKTIRNS